MPCWEVERKALHKVRRGWCVCVSVSLCFGDLNMINHINGWNGTNSHFIRGERMLTGNLRPLCVFVIPTLLYTGILTAYVTAHTLSSILVAECGHSQRREESSIMIIFRGVMRWNMRNVIMEIREVKWDHMEMLLYYRLEHCCSDFTWTVIPLVLICSWFSPLICLMTFWNMIFWDEKFPGLGTLGHVECEIIVLNPNLSTEPFQRTESVPSVLIWPSSGDCPEGITRN